MKSRAIALFAFVVMSLAGRLFAQEDFTSKEYTYNYDELNKLTFTWDKPAHVDFSVDEILSIATESSTLTRATVRTTDNVYVTIDFPTAFYGYGDPYRPDPLSVDGARVIVEALRGFEKDRASFRPLTCMGLYRRASGSTTYVMSPQSEIHIDVASPIAAPQLYPGVEDGVLKTMYLWDHADIWTSVTIIRPDGSLMNLHLVRASDALSNVTLAPMTADQAVAFNSGILAPPHWVYVSGAYRPYGGVRYLVLASRWTNQ